MPQALTLSRPVRGLKLVAADVKARTTELWHAYPREMLGFGLLTLAAAAVIGGAAHSTPELAVAARTQAPPAPPPLLVRQLAPEQALQLNQEIPVARGPNPVARPFIFKGSAAARTQALQCLASAVYYEAGSQDVDGERAVAQVVLNRVRHPAFPASVCGVVYEGSTRPTGCQFTFTCDGSLYRQPDSRGLETSISRRGRSAFGLRLRPGRLRYPLSCRLCRTLLGLDLGKERRGRRPHLLSLERGLGSADGVQ